MKDAPIAVPAIAENGRPLQDWLQPVDVGTATFRAIGTQGEQVTSRPLNESWERFAVYLRVT